MRNNGREAYTEFQSKGAAHPSHPRTDSAQDLDFRGSPHRSREVVQTLLLPYGWVHGSTQKNRAGAVRVLLCAAEPAELCGHHRKRDQGYSENSSLGNLSFEPTDKGRL